MSLREQLAEYRAAGGSLRTQDWYRLWSQTVSLREQAKRASMRDRDTIPGADEIQERDTELARGYGQWVLVTQRTRGEGDMIVTPFLVKTADPITPGDAETQAVQWATQDERKYNRRLLGVTYIGTERFNPRSRR